MKFMRQGEVVKECRFGAALAGIQCDSVVFEREDFIDVANRSPEDVYAWMVHLQLKFPPPGRNDPRGVLGATS